MPYLESLRKYDEDNDCNRFTSSLLDLLIFHIYKINLVARFGQLLLPGISDHDLIYMSFNDDILVPEPRST